MNKVAILIDGGFYLRNLAKVRQDIDINSPEEVTRSIRQLVRGHLFKLAKTQQSYLVNSVNKKQEFVLQPDIYASHYRTFYYDAEPLSGETQMPKSGKTVNFAKTNTHLFRKTLFDALRKQRNLALRLGETKADPDYFWQIRPKILKDLVNGKKEFSTLTDEDFAVTIRQKGVDMRMGIDMASIALKKQANIFVLVTGDADFVPAAKLVRREGCEVILDSLHRNVPSELFEHIDALTSGFKANSTNDKQNA